ncbi:MAG TPA: PLP-dependent aminotransferase family protein [Candidatus Binatia bacterium]|nr:PLP-dependent aminotransferase family protein [Candidatus Binatia bacterium]
MLEIAFHPDRTGHVALVHQLTEHLADLIQTGRLAGGSKLPATREAAGALGVGRNTVSAAYAALTTRGLVTAHVGQGTFVASPTRLTPAAPRATAPAPREFAWNGLFARSTPRPRLPHVFRRAELGGSCPFDFRGGRVESDALPLHELRWAFARPFASRARLRALAAPPHPLGWPALRREVARYLAGRGIACTADDVAIVGGLQHAIDLTARALVDPGDTVAMEQPGYFGAALAFEGCGADLLGVGVDAEGIRTDQLARVLRVRRVKLVYVTPATQSPTGVGMSPARRSALLALADEHQVPILEDDYDSELRYAGPALPALKSGDAAGQVVYAGTFSKVLFPSLRLGYVVAARPLLARLATMRLASDFGSGVVAQAALATLLATRGFDRHVRRMRRLYAARLAALLAALRRDMPAGTRWMEPRSGHVVWVTLPPGIDPERLEHAARDRGVAYTRGETFHVDGRGGDSLALSFAPLDPRAIAEGVARLGAAVRMQITTERVPGHVRPPAVRSGRGRRPAGRSLHGAR